MSPADSPSPDLQSVTILAVDDDRAILNLLGAALRDAGYQVLTAEGAWGAIQAYEDCPGPVHLLVTDVIMPDLSGFVLADRLRARQPDLPVMLISGFHDAAMVQPFVARRGFTFLPKPFSIEGLLRGVDESLRSPTPSGRTRTSGSNK